MDRSDILLMYSLAIFPWVVTVSEINIALGKPAFQVSEFDYGIYGYFPSLAVDGNKSTIIERKSCTHTQLTGTYPWWAVDLERTAHVTSVKLTNREGWGYRLKNIYVGVTYNDPRVTAPACTNFDLCTFYAGPIADAAPETLHNKLLISLSFNYNAATLECELNNGVGTATAADGWNYCVII